MEKRTVERNPKDSRLISGLFVIQRVNVSKAIKYTNRDKKTFQNCFVGLMAGFFVILRNSFIRLTPNYLPPFKICCFNCNKFMEYFKGVGEFDRRSFLFLFA